MKRPLLVLLLAFFAARMLGQQCVLDTTFGIGGRVQTRGSNANQRVIALPDSSVQFAWTEVTPIWLNDANYQAFTWNYAMDFNGNGSWGPSQSPWYGAVPMEATYMDRHVDMKYRNRMTYYFGRGGGSGTDTRDWYICALDSAGSLAWKYAELWDPSSSTVNCAAFVGGWGGKVYLAGKVPNGAFVSCLTDSGTIDPNWNSNSLAVIHDASPNEDRYFETVTQDHQGRIVVAGRAVFNQDLANQNSQVLMARFHIDGSLDSSFGTNGIAYFDHPDWDHVESWEIHALDQGRYAVAGSLLDEVDYPYLGDADPFVLQVLESGLADTSYGAGGWAWLDISGQGRRDENTDSEMLLDGRMLIAGYTTISSTNYVSWMLLLDAQGQPDPSFAASGIYHLSDLMFYPARINSICRHPAGKIYVETGYDGVYRFNFAPAGGVVADAEPAGPSAAFSLFPNPTHSGGRLVVPGAERIPVQLLDLQGRVLAEWPRGGELQLPHVAAGMYLVRAGGTTRRLQVR